ncbi:MAG: FecR domain-containing protein, partial [Alphaproteobacteria bacterium]|nr:FecR domain-containing protein [Alphaproteobacteria bacterium]
MRAAMPRLALAVAALCATSFSAASAAETIGVTAAVKGRAALVTGTEAPRAAGSGTEVRLNDRVQTGAESALQLLLRDQTTFTVGANSDLVIDRFVYDPNASTGAILASVSKGAFRYVSGQVAKSGPDNVKIKLPQGMLGVRGTTLQGAAQADGSWSIFNTGAKSGNNAGERASVATFNGQEIKSGFKAQISAAGGLTISKISQAELQQLQGSTKAASTQGAQSGGQAQQGGRRTSDSGVNAGQASGQNEAKQTEDAKLEAGAREAQDDLTDDAEDDEPIDDIAGFFDPDAFIEKWSNLPSVGTAAYDEAGVPVYACASCFGATVKDVLRDFSLLDGPEVGSFDVSASVNFAARQITVNVTNIVTTFGVSGTAGAAPANFDTAGQAFAPGILLNA